MKINITMSLFNRPEYSRQALDHLHKCINSNQYQVLVHIDRSPYTDELMEMVAEYSSDLDIHCFSPSKNLGCNRSVYECLDWSFEDADFNIHIEDDILLAKDALQYFEWCAKEFVDDKTIFTVDGYNNVPYELNSNKEYEILKTPSYKPWGWCIWKDRWSNIKDNWGFSYGAIYEQGKRIYDGGSWDLKMKKLLRGDRCRIFPTLARSRNIGEVGLHTPSKEWHNKKHGIEWWAENAITKFPPKIDFHF